MDCSVQVRTEDYHNNQEHCAERNNNCMAMQETKVLVSKQK